MNLPSTALLLPNLPNSYQLGTKCACMGTFLIQKTHTALSLCPSSKLLTAEMSVLSVECFTGVKDESS